MYCNEPIVVSDLPYQVKGDKTSNYGNHWDVMQGTGCGASPSTTNYFKGIDVFYSYTPSSTGFISVTVTPIGSASTNSSVFVYEGCANVGVACVGGMANVLTMNIHLNHLAAIQRVFGCLPCDMAALLQIQSALQTPQAPQG